VILPLEIDNKSHYDKDGFTVSQFWEVSDGDGSLIETFSSRKMAMLFIHLVNGFCEDGGFIGVVWDDYLGQLEGLK